MITQKENIEKLIKGINKLLTIIGFIYLLSLIVIISFPFIWIWGSWYYTWRILLTGILSTLVLGAIYNGIKKYKNQLEILNKKT